MICSNYFSVIPTVAIVRIKSIISFVEAIKNFFTSESFKDFWITVYNGFEQALDFAFGKIKYAPIQELLTNPWFWIILVGLFLISLIFRRR